MSAKHALFGTYVLFLLRPDKLIGSICRKRAAEMG